MDTGIFVLYIYVHQIDETHSHPPCADVDFWKVEINVALVKNDLITIWILSV